MAALKGGLFAARALFVVCGKWGNFHRQSLGIPQKQLHRQQSIIATSIILNSGIFKYLTASGRGRTGKVKRMLAYSVFLTAKSR